LAALNAAAIGMPQLPIIVLPTPLGLAGDLSEDEVSKLTRTVVDQFEAVLTTRDLTDLERTFSASRFAQTEEISKPALRLESTEPELLMEYMEAHGASDGLPFVPPTEERVHRMLEYSLLDPEAEILKVSPRRGVLTPRRLAACAVMAGCRPEYYPVLESAFAAMSAPSFNLGGMATTTGEAWPSIVVSGPYAREIGMESGFGLFGPGNRANMTIGRAITLVLFAVGGALPGSGSYATFGNLTRRGLAFAEDLNAPWAPLHVETGHPDETVVLVVSTINPSLMVDETESAENVLYCTARHIAIPGTRGDYNPGPYLIVFNPSHRDRLAAAGYGKDDIRRYLYENARQPFELLRQLGAQPGRKRWPKWVYGNPYDGMVPYLRDPSDAIVLSAGGAVAAHTAIFPTWLGNSDPQVVPLRIPPRKDSA
jgi:hypothetical protein